MQVKTKAIFATLVTVAFLPLAASAESGFFLGGSIGSSSLDDDIEGFGIDADTTAYRFVLGYQLGDVLSFEAGYHSFGKFDEEFDIAGAVTDVTLRADGYTVGGTLGLPVTDTLSLFGRAGAFIWDADARVGGVRLSLPEDTNAYYGGGAGVAVTDRFSLIGDWTRYEFEDANSDVISIGFKYRF